jgi:hypothetical protein
MFPLFTRLTSRRHRIFNVVKADLDVPLVEIPDPRDTLERESAPVEMGREQGKLQRQFARPKLLSCVFAGHALLAHLW